jgi:hypothetical protein
MDDLTVKSIAEAKEPSELVSLEECKRQLAKYNLSDEQVSQLKNSLIGIVDNIINSYLNEFDQT